MNRNSESGFNSVPRLRNPRSTFESDFHIPTTLNEGDLIPIYVQEILPGDTFRIDMAAVVRMSTPLYPVMDNCYMDTYFFYVPNRLLWEHWGELLGENNSTFWAQPVEYSVPQTTAPKGGWNVGTIADYMGIPTGIENLSVMSLPFRAYAKIWNEWFRDENLQQPVVQDMDDATNAGSNTGTELTDAENGGLPLKVARYHDYFSSCLPNPQRGEASYLPLSGIAPVGYGSAGYSETLGWTSLATSLGTYDKTATYTKENPALGGIILGTAIDTNTQTTSTIKINSPDREVLDLSQNQTTIYADLANSTAQITINQLRQAIAVQHILEADARQGTRLKEILQGTWGVTSPDARIDRSEYIGGTRVPININQVLQTSSTDTTSPQGNTGAYSCTSMAKHMATYSSYEHGWIIGLAAVRVQHSYQQGLRRFWSRKTRFDFYDPRLANLGEMAVLNKEIYAQGTDEDNEVFGYQEAWADYRYNPSYVTSEMRSTYKQSLDAWHYADEYSSLPTLSSDWIKEPRENIDRTIAVTSELSHQFIADFGFRVSMTRELPVYSVPGLDNI